MKIEPWAKFRMPIVPQARLMPRANSRYNEPRVRALSRSWAMSSGPLREQCRGGAGAGGSPPAPAGGRSGTALDQDLLGAVPLDEHAGHPGVAVLERHVALGAVEALVGDGLEAVLDGGAVGAVGLGDAPREEPHPVVGLGRVVVRDLAV